MDNVFFDNPPVLVGDDKTQMRQLHGYLEMISQKLNEALMTVTIEAANEAEERVRSGLKNTEEPDNTYTTLKSLIIKSAEIVRTEMQEISTELHSETQAISNQFGTLVNQIDATIRATAEGVLQDYHYNETVAEVANNTVYRNHTNQYIFTGLINSSPVEYGVAIGEGVTAYDQDGNPYLNQNAKLATFTMNKLSFWQGSTELAYFASGKFYISNGEITNTLQIGNYIWKVLSDNSIALVRS